jgi:hypothetical protein
VRLCEFANSTASGLFLGVAVCKLFDRGLDIMWALPFIAHLNTTSCFAVAHSALSAARDKR